MNCPNCGKENPDNAQFCQSCNAPMIETSKPDQQVTVRVSRLAIIAILLGISSLLFFVPSSTFLKNLIAMLNPLILLSTFTLGIISLILIEISGGKITGRSYAIAAILIPPFMTFLIICFTFSRTRSTAFRPVCGTNLSRIGKMMLIYAGDYDEKFPRAGGKDSVWSNSIPDWQAYNQLDAFGLNADGTGGRVTITSSFYHLAKYAELDPKYFICSQEKGVKKFKPSAYVKSKRNLIDFWDFGPEPRKHCSYSYHLPYGPYPLNTSCDPDLAVAADPSPWMKAPAAEPKNFAEFDPDGNKKEKKAGNSPSHQGDGQNVLFMDLHVSFNIVSFCGINDDNIYTYWDGQDIRRGAVPNIKSQPAGRLDSMMVNDLP